MDSISDSISNFSTIGGIVSGSEAGNVSLTAHSTTSKVNLGDTCQGFQFFFNTVVFGSLCVFGFLGNAVSILVLQRDGYNRVAVFLLQSLAVADNSVLCLSFLALSIFYGLVPVVGRDFRSRTEPHVIRYLNPLGCIAQSCAIWTTVLLALNRYLAVCRPFKSKKWLTMKMARIQVIVVVAISIFLNIPRFFVTEILDIGKSSNRSDLNSTANTNNNNSAPNPFWYFEVIYMNAFYTSVVLIFPLLLLFGFNIPIVRQLQKSKRMMIQNSLSYSGDQENNITVVMVIIILELIICHAPDRILQVFIFFTPMEQRRCPSWLHFATSITNFLVMFNSSTDFIVYYVFRRRFRSILCDRLHCRPTKPRLQNSDSERNAKKDQGKSPLVKKNSNGNLGLNKNQGTEHDQSIRQTAEL